MWRLRFDLIAILLWQLEQVKGKFYKAAEATSRICNFKFFACSGGDKFYKAEADVRVASGIKVHEFLTKTSGRQELVFKLNRCFLFDQPSRSKPINHSDPDTC